MPHYYLVISAAGPNRDLSKGTREQAYWDDHAAFIDNLVDEGFIVLGGPLPDEHGAMIVVQDPNEASVRQKLRSDPWYQHGILQLVSIQRWEVFINEFPHPGRVDAGSASVE